MSNHQKCVEVIEVVIDRLEEELPGGVLGRYTCESVFAHHVIKEECERHGLDDLDVIAVTTAFYMGVGTVYSALKNRKCKIGQVC